MAESNKERPKPRDLPPPKLEVLVEIQKIDGPPQIKILSLAIKKMASEKDQE